MQIGIINHPPPLTALLENVKQMIFSGLIFSLVSMKHTLRTRVAVLPTLSIVPNETPLQLKPYVLHDK